MKSITFFLLLFALVGCNNRQKQVELTYIANAGFLLTSNSTSILIDALHKHGPNVYLKPSSGLLDSMIQGNSMFRKIDFLFITHRHPDHFNDSLTFEFLSKHRETQLICPVQVTEILKKNGEIYQKFSDRISTIALDTGRTERFEVAGLKFSASHSRHADDYEVENLIYIIELNGTKIMHSGDSYDVHAMELNDINFKAEQIDLAILTAGYGRNKFSIAKEQIRPKEIVFCHFYQNLSERLATAMEKDTATFENITVFFNRLESRKYQFK
ncbi:MAG: MBL fold metallo-hydrolase [Marinifilaceae bacterium]